MSQDLLGEELKLEKKKKKRRKEGRERQGGRGREGREDGTKEKTRHKEMGKD